MTDYESGQEDPALAGGNDLDGLPKWEQDRIGKITRQKHEQRERAEAAERHVATLEGRLQALEGQVSSVTAPQAKSGPEPKGVAAFQSVAECKQAAKQIYEYQTLAMDPDADPEARQAARSKLAAVDDIAGVQADIQARMAEIISDDRDSKYRAERSEMDAEAAGRNALTQHLFLQYGQEALAKDSELTKATAGLIQEWINSGDVTEANSGQDFIVKMAFKEAASKLKRNGRGGRENDPRHSAIESGGGSRAPAGDDVVAALRKRGAAGDWSASRKAYKLETENFLKGLQSGGLISG